jgi:hypothetical protein
MVHIPPKLTAVVLLFVTVHAVEVTDENNGSPFGGKEFEGTVHLLHFPAI